MFRPVLTVIAAAVISWHDRKKRIATPAIWAITLVLTITAWPHDAMRYQRGPDYLGEHYPKMSADVHQRAGMSQATATVWQSLAAGQQSAKRLPRLP